jgi:tRNA(Ile)-lysidine synthase TilS/MesJ
MNNKKIKTINEFLDLNEIEIDLTKYTEDEMDIYEDLMRNKIDENIKKLDIKNNKPTIEKFRKKFNELIQNKKCTLSIDELDKICMKNFGEKFIENK